VFKVTAMTHSHPTDVGSIGSFDPAEFKDARAAYHAARARRYPARWRSVQREAVAALDAHAEAERCKAVSMLLRVPRPVVYGQITCPRFLMPTKQWGLPRRLIDHEVLFRLKGSRGPASIRDTITLTEPYLPDEDVEAALNDWQGRLAPHGLKVRRLSKDLIFHAPNNRHSQIFAVASPTLMLDAP
jgi:hypothetical protein